MGQKQSAGSLFFWRGCQSAALHCLGGLVGGNTPCTACQNKAEGLGGGSPPMNGMGAGGGAPQNKADASPEDPTLKRGTVGQVKSSGKQAFVQYP